ncbi:MAG TPA: FAD-dependent oxidoreductase, partial [Stellaceae bacterium]|nr:FAD-dependent oxidoreductase [Stellaceae bacterium]
MTRFVIIGAGPAGMRAAEMLRRGSADADILLIGDEPHLPYDRPPLSKGFITDALAPAKIYLKPASFYDDERIRLKLGVAATHIDRAAKMVTLADGERVAYDKLLLAMGCGARTLPPTLATAPVHYLRSLADAERIRAALRPGTSLVVIGGGFIGLEIAASARQLGAAVTVLEMAPRLMARAMPEVVSDFARRRHEAHGVRFELPAQLLGLEPLAQGRAAIVTAAARHEADLVVAGIGAFPNTALAAAAGLALEDGIRVDACGRTSDPDIFAAGDVSRHENPLLGRAIRVESWQVALNQAGFVARAMLGANEPYIEIPWLWTDQYDCNIQALGFFDPGLRLLQRGDPAGASFTVLGLAAGGAIAAAVTVN